MSKLKLIPDNKRKKHYSNTRKMTKTQKMQELSSANVSQSSGELLYGWNAMDFINQNKDEDWYKKMMESVNDVINKNNQNNDDDEVETQITSIFSDDDGSSSAMDYVIRNMVESMTVPNTNATTLNKGNASTVDLGSQDGGEVVAGTSDTSVGSIGVTWDPRLIRLDGFQTGSLFVPFSSPTASSAYYDHLFVIEQGVLDITEGMTGDSVSSVTSDATTEYKDPTRKGSYKVAPNKEQVNMLKGNPDMYGVQSLVNPYCVTRLVGGLSINGNGSADRPNLRTHMYDIRDQKRFYDNVQDPTGNGLVQTADDFTSIGNPTTDNIIKWSNNDKWGRTPYSFQDFVFCKFWNIIPNNRLITFRKYAVPTYDNLNFPNMLNDDGSETKGEYSRKFAAPVATVVSYFGGDSANKLNDLLKFTTGTKWKNIDAEIHKAGGNEGSNPRALIDSMFEGRGGFGGQSSASQIVANFLSPIGAVTADYISFGKFVGLLDADGYRGHSQKAWENLTRAQMDPRETIYHNRIVGPVNRISSVQARDAGLEFAQSFTLTCEYIARPIGGVNTKAAMLDILANCMEIASADAVFWGGGYQFMVMPHMYPFKGMPGRNTLLEDLYNGNIFGTEGAIAHSLQGVLEFGKKNKDGQTTSSFEWSNVTSRLGDVLSQTVGAIGNMLQSMSSAIFGESSSLSKFLGKVTDAVSDEEAQEKGKAKLSNMFTNLNKMWKDRVLEETMMPNIDGIRSILSGQPTGNWHLTVGNPLNPILVCGNLICKKMDVSWSEELGPDDFPMGLTVTYSIEHAMARDKSSIQSMFNRGAGKIYKLPDYLKSSSDYESTVDKYTGENNKDVNKDGAWVNPRYMHAKDIMDTMGVGTYQTFKIESGKPLAMLGNPDTTSLTCFTPVDREAAYQTVGNNPVAFLNSKGATPRAAYFANLHTIKYNNG